MKSWLGYIWLVVAIFLGSAAFSGLRTLNYIYKGLQPNMAPQMFILFSPVLAAPVALVTLLIHIVFYRYFKFDSFWKWFLPGISYSSLLLGLISPWLLIIPLVLNPISLKLIVNARKAHL